MYSLVSTNVDESQPSLRDTNETKTSWTARLFHGPASPDSSMTVTVVPRFEKKGNSYKQVPAPNLCGIQQVQLERSSQTNLKRDEVSDISPEERLEFSLILNDDSTTLPCILIHEQGDVPGEYLYICPQDLKLSKLREIVKCEDENVLERMFRLTTTAIIQKESDGITSLYNYCENNAPMNSTPTTMGDLALLTALELGGVVVDTVSSQNNTLSPIEDLADRLTDTIVRHAKSKFCSKGSYEKTMRNLVKKSAPVASFYTDLDSALFCPLRSKTDAHTLLFSKWQLMVSFVLFVVIFPFYALRKIFRCDKHFFKAANEGNFHQPTRSRGFVFLSYFSLFLSIASILIYYIKQPDDGHDEYVHIWVPFILTLVMLVFAHLNIGAIHLKFSIPRFTSIKLSYEKAQVLVLRPHQSDSLVNDNTETNPENRKLLSAGLDISWVKKEYMDISTAFVKIWFVVMVVLFLLATAGQIALFEVYHLKHDKTTTLWIISSSWPEKLIYIVTVFTIASIMIVLNICANFYFEAYFVIKGIVDNIQENDYERKEVKKFDVRKPESLEYLLTLIRVIVGSINDSLPQLIMIGCTVLVLLSLTIIALYNYIKYHALLSFPILSCLTYIGILAVPSIIILFLIASINATVTKTLPDILLHRKQRLINEIVRKQMLARHQRRDTTYEPSEDLIPELIIARDYLHEQTSLLNNKEDISPVKLLNLIPINRALLISVIVTAGGAVSPYLLALIK